jgi:hypothetical protein
MNRIKSHNIAVFIILLGAILILFAPAILLSPAFHSVFDLSKGGDLGNAIGGLTAPIVGFLGSILIYLGFHEQVKANRYQKRVNKHQRKINSRNEELRKSEISWMYLSGLMEMRNTLINRYQNFTYTTMFGQNLHGEEAFRRCYWKVNQPINSILEDERRILNVKFYWNVVDFKMLLDYADDLILTDGHRKMFNGLCITYFYTQLCYHMEKLIELSEKERVKEFEEYPFIVSDYIDLIKRMKELGGNEVNYRNQEDKNIDID